MGRILSCWNIFSTSCQMVAGLFLEKVFEYVKLILGQVINLNILSGTDKLTISPSITERSGEANYLRVTFSIEFVRKLSAIGQLPFFFNVQ